MRIIIVQYAGDYREAVYRFAAGGGETFHAQKHSVDLVAAIAEEVEEIAVLCCLTESSYNEMLPNGVRAIGAGFSGTVDFTAVIKLIADYQPTHLSLNTPVRQILHWANRNRVATLAALADSFSKRKLRDRITTYLLARALNHSNVQWVANHGVAAAESLKAIGVNSEKIIPYDWPHPISPNQFAVKSLPSQAHTLVYVGSLMESKGVGDALAAVAVLQAKGCLVKLKVVGKGELEVFQQQAQALGITDSIEFLGLINNQQVIPLMRSADVVLVPSRHEYPEGFPLTIYEALSSRTPIVASDHPMFVKQLHHRVNAMLFPGGQPTAMAEQIETLLTDAALYRQLSEASQSTWERLQIPVKMEDLLNRWVANSPVDRAWLSQHSLASGQYRRTDAVLATS